MEPNSRTKEKSHFIAQITIKFNMQMLKLKPKISHPKCNSQLIFVELRDDHLIVRKVSNFNVNTKGSEKYTCCTADKISVQCHSQ
jgi:aspartyl-tRNA synthetase